MKTISSIFIHLSSHSYSSTSTTTIHSPVNTTNITRIHTLVTSETNKTSTTHILQTLWKSITITATSTCTVLPLYTLPKINPLSKTSIQPSTKLHLSNKHFHHSNTCHSHFNLFLLSLISISPRILSSYAVKFNTWKCQTQINTKIHIKRTPIHFTHSNCQTFSTQHNHNYTRHPTNMYSAHFQLHQSQKCL